MTKILLLRFIIFLTAFTFTLIGTKSISMSLALGKNLFTEVVSNDTNQSTLSVKPQSKIENGISTTITNNQSNFSLEEIHSTSFVSIVFPLNKIIDKPVIFNSQNALPVIMLAGKFRPPSV